MDKISIIMPAYNCEKTIVKAIDSVIQQTYQNWELIIINDGSSDGTDKIVKKYEKDSRIVCISKKNEGVSIARNIGINKATGKYLMFIDSDDTYHELMLEKMINHCSNVELVCCSYDMITDDADYIKGPNLKNQLIGETQELDKAINYLHHNKSLKMLWNKMFNLSIVKENKLMMDYEFDYGEDYLFVIDYLSKIDHIAIIEDHLYHYFVHAKGLSTRQDRDSLGKRMYTLQYHETMYKERKFPLDYLKSQYIISFYAEILNGYLNHHVTTYQDKIKQIENYLRRTEFSQIVQEKFQCSWKIKILKMMMKYNMKHTILFTMSIGEKWKSKEKFYQYRKKG